MIFDVLETVKWSSNLWYFYIHVINLKSKHPWQVKTRFIHNIFRPFFCIKHFVYELKIGKEINYDTFIKTSQGEFLLSPFLRNQAHPGDHALA